MSLSSEEVNFLVYRYLLESGFIHSAFAFGHESLIAKSSIDGTKVAPGALISFIQKGLQFVEIEAHINEDGTETICDNAFSAIQPHTCNIKNKRRIFDPYAVDHEENGFGAQEATEEDVSYLKGHQNIVCSCKWHPSQPILATGSGDATARLWIPSSGEMKSNDDQIDSKSKENEKVVVMAIPNQDVSVDKDQPSPSMVVSLEWNVDGSQLATGTYKGRTHVWSADGQLKRTLDQHSAPISAIRWNKSADRLLTASIDNTAILWNPKSGQMQKRYTFHKAPITDADWNDDSTFAICSIDRTISIWNIDEKSESDSSVPSTPEIKLEGHADDINMIRWSSTASILASCSDDSTVKLWNTQSRACIQDLNQHNREVCAIQWNKTGLLASGSLDSTVRLWDAESGKCVNTFSKHLHPVSNIAFNRDGDLLAAASHDRMYVWSVKNEELVKTIKTDGGINALSWDCTGHRLAGGCTNNEICILDIRM